MKRLTRFWAQRPFALVARTRSSRRGVMSAPAPAERPALPRKSTHPTLVVEEDTEMHAEEKIAQNEPSSPLAPELELVHSSSSPDDARAENVIQATAYAESGATEPGRVLSKEF